MNFISEIIGYPLGFVMWALYQITHNYAVAILLFTIVTRVILLPLAFKQQKSTAAMAAFTPKLEELKKKYAGNQQKLNEEQMKLYSEEGINPMSSCLPLLVQFPLLIGIFDVVYRPLTHIIRASKDVITQATEIAATIYGTNQSFTVRPEIYIVRAIKDQPDLFSGLPLEFVEKVQDFNNMLFGFIDLGMIPSFKPEVWDAASIGLIMIPIMSGLAQLGSTVYMYIRQKKMQAAGGATKNSADGMQKSMMNSMNVMLFVMPVFSVYIAIGYPAAIGFYWTCSALIGFAQSVLLNKVYTPEYVAGLVEKDKLKKKDKTKKRNSMMERYQQMLAEQNGTVTPEQTNRNSITVSGKLKDDEDEPKTEAEKISKSKQREIERKLINEARRRQAEKYGEEYIDE
ncbi:MAG: YidC/Oxa1 family membrane protein insertase [Ruminococcus sp.]|nr:YidC/Oxa1 family membrane protein insertase [Ruminococcus sp.]